jgi:hypothetical protein
MKYLPVAIPSYQRSKIISQKTLKFLNQVKYPSDLITIFVSDTDELEKYILDVPRNLYGQIVIGKRGLNAQRRFISDYYKEDEIICCMDDDITKIVCPYLTFRQILEKAYIELTLNKCGLWGILSNDDARKFSDEMTTHLTHIIGSFFIVRNHRDVILETESKDDYERSILYFIRYGNVRRYRGAGVRTNYAKTPGGLQQTGRIDRMQQEALYLSQKYPLYCKMIVKKDMPDLRLNWRAII